MIFKNTMLLKMGPFGEKTKIIMDNRCVSTQIVIMYLKAPQVQRVPLGWHALTGHSGFGEGWPKSCF